MTSATFNTELTPFALRELARSLNLMADGLEPQMAEATSPHSHTGEFSPMAPVANQDDFNLLEDTVAAQNVFAGNAAPSAPVPVVPPISATVSTVEAPAPTEGGKIAPPVEAPAATTSTSTTTGSVSTVDLDSEGLPWDGRIHSSSRQKLVKGGGWKKIRGVDPELVEKVEAELRQALAAGKPASSAGAPSNPIASPAANPAPVTIATAPATPPAGVIAPSATAPESQIAPPPPPVAPVEAPAIPFTPTATGTAQTAPTAVAPATTTGSPSNFPEFMRALTSKGYSAESVSAVVQSFGLPNLPTLATRPDLIPDIAAALGL